MIETPKRKDTKKTEKALNLLGISIPFTWCLCGKEAV